MSSQNYSSNVSLSDMSVNTARCEDHLSEREVIIIAVSATLVASCSAVILALLVWLWCKRRKSIQRSSRLHARLETLSVRDPLEELVRRESTRSISNISNVTGLDTWSRNLYKIWDITRLNRQFVFANTLDDLITKAKDKLKTASEVRIVLEEDGTQVTTDDELRACHGVILMLLEQGDVWPPPPVPGTQDFHRVVDDGLSYTGSVTEMTETTSNYSNFPEETVGSYYNDSVKL